LSRLSLTGAPSSPVGRGNLDRVGGSYTSDWHHTASPTSNSHDGDSQTENETTDDELRDSLGSRGNDHTDDNDNTTGKHSLSSTVSVGEDSSEGCADHGSTEAVRTCLAWSTHTV
jgi:hypothetical protein